MPVGIALVRVWCSSCAASDRPDRDAVLVDEKRIFVGAVHGAAILDHAQPPGCDLVQYPMIERDHAIGDVFLQAVAGQRAFAALARHDDGDALFLEPAKEPCRDSRTDRLV